MQVGRWEGGKVAAICVCICVLVECADDGEIVVWHWSCHKVNQRYTMIAEYGGGGMVAVGKAMAIKFIIK